MWLCRQDGQQVWNEWPIGGVFDPIQRSRLNVVLTIDRASVERRVFAKWYSSTDLCRRQLLKRAKIYRDFSMPYPLQRCGMKLQKP